MSCLLRRADTVEVIGAALAARAAGAGHRSIADRLGRAPETVRGWLRRFAGRVETVRVFFISVLVRVEIDPVISGPAGSAWADAFTAIAGAWTATSSRFRGGDVGLLPVWRSVCALTSGLVLSPSWRPVVINTNCP